MGLPRCGSRFSRKMAHDLQEIVTTIETAGVFRMKNSKKMAVLLILGLGVGAVWADDLTRRARFAALYGAEEEGSDGAVGAPSALQELSVALARFAASGNRWLVGLEPAAKGERALPNVLWLRRTPTAAYAHVDDTLLDELPALRWDEVLAQRRENGKLELVLYRARRGDEVRANGFIVPDTARSSLWTVAKKDGAWRLEWTAGGRRMTAAVPPLSVRGPLPVGSDKRLDVVEVKAGARRPRPGNAGNAGSGAATGADEAVAEVRQALDGFGAAGDRRVVGLLATANVVDRGPHVLWLSSGTRGASLFLDEFLVDDVPSADWQGLVASRREGVAVELLVYRLGPTESVRTNGYVIPGTRDLYYVDITASGRRQWPLFGQMGGRRGPFKELCHHPRRRHRRIPGPLCCPPRLRQEGSRGRGQGCCGQEARLTSQPCEE